MAANSAATCKPPRRSIPIRLLSKSMSCCLSGWRDHGFTRVGIGDLDFAVSVLLTIVTCKSICLDGVHGGRPPDDCIVQSSNRGMLANTTTEDIYFFDKATTEDWYLQRSWWLSYISCGADIEDHGGRCHRPTNSPTTMAIEGMFSLIVSYVEFL
jgi:hypothetical protein